MLQILSFALYPSTVVTSRNLGCPSSRGAREGAGSGPGASTAPHGGGRCSGPGESVPAAPASSQPLHSALFRAPGTINRGSWNGAAALALPPPPCVFSPAVLARPRVTAAKFRGGRGHRPGHCVPRPCLRFQSLRSGLCLSPAQSLLDGIRGRWSPYSPSPQHSHRAQGKLEVGIRGRFGSGAAPDSGVARELGLRPASGGFQRATLGAGKIRTRGAKAQLRIECRNQTYK